MALIDRNINDLYARLDKETTNGVIAVNHMLFGNIAQSQSDYEFYTMDESGMAYKLDINLGWVRREFTATWLYRQQWRLIKNG